MTDVAFAGSRASRAEGERSLLMKVPDLLDTAGLPGTVVDDDLVALKMHLGSSGGFRTIRPEFVNGVINKVRLTGARPFIAESCRPDAVRYLEIAHRRGYNQGTLGCPIIIVDGFKGEDFKTVETGGKIVKEVDVPSGIYHSPSMIVLTHVTGHGNASFAGSIKNIAMGCTARSSKGKIHRSVNVDPPIWNSEKCIACGDCVEACNYGAISLVDGKIEFDVEKCERCMRCVRECTHEGLKRPSPMRKNFLQALVDGVSGVLSTFEENRVLFVNFLTGIGPECDCAPFSDNPIVQDFGILASTDIVSLEKASLDLITEAPSLPNSVASEEGLESNDKKFKGIHGLDPVGQIEAAEEAGLGSSEYNLVDVK